MAELNRRGSYMNQTNCHNCGAPITGPECEYCGTRFTIRVVEPEREIINLYADNKLITSLIRCEYDERERHSCGYY